MSVMTPTMRLPIAVPVLTRLRARASARSGVFMKAPGPDLTSKTRASAPSATFLERMEAVMRGMDSTVAVTSRRA